MNKENYWSVVWRKFKRNRRGMVGLYIVLFFFLVALFAPLIANDKPYIYISETNEVYFPLFYNHQDLKDVDLRNVAYKGFKIFPPIAYSYSEYDLDSIVVGPSWKHIFGTDEQGRDLAARMIHGTRVSILIGFIAVFIYISIGIILGSLAGYYGGWIDIVISRIIEIVMCFPTFFLILTLLAIIDVNAFENSFIDPGLLCIMFVIGITGWTGIARLVRGEFLKLREADFVIASKAIGARDYWIIFKHILPNSLAPILVSATFGIASTILIESSLSFLGFGVQPPRPSWGEILSQSREFMDFAWWLTFIPGFAIFITITSYNLVGESLQNAIDPKS